MVDLGSGSLRNLAETSGLLGLRRRLRVQWWILKQGFAVAQVTEAFLGGSC